MAHKAGKQKGKAVNYEIIDTKYTKEVVGVCSDPADCDEEGHVFGEITEEQAQAFGDNPWSQPISTKRFKMEPQPPKLVEVPVPNPNVQNSMTVAWRVVASDLNQYVASGGKLMCPAVLGACGPALETVTKLGQFWWNGGEGRGGYEPTIELAKAKVEEAQAEWISKNKS